MDIMNMRETLIEKWDSLNLYDCLLQEVFELRGIVSAQQLTILDLQNKVKMLEYMSPSVKSYFDHTNSHILHGTQKKP